MSDSQNCGSGGGDDRFFGLRVASLFIILVGSSFGALFPVVTARTKWFKIPKAVYECVFLLILICGFSHLIVPSFAKYFGSGVIVRVIQHRFLPSKLVVSVRLQQLLSIYWLLRSQN
jgi:zinc transporter 1/2/3